MKLKKVLMNYLNYLNKTQNGMRVLQKKLLEFFDLLGFNDPNVIVARKKLSSMMFK